MPKTGVTVNCPFCGFVHQVSWSPFIAAEGTVVRRVRSCDECKNVFEQRFSFSVHPLQDCNLKSPLEISVKPEIVDLHQKMYEERSILRAMDAVCLLANALNKLTRKVKRELPSTASLVRQILAAARTTRKEVIESLQGGTDVNLEVGKQRSPGRKTTRGA